MMIFMENTDIVLLDHINNKESGIWPRVLFPSDSRRLNFRESLLKNLEGTYDNAGALFGILYALLQGDRVVARIDQNVVYRSLTEDPANIYSLLLVAGYLKTTKKQLQGDGSWLCEASIPNREIASVYKRENISHLMQVGAMGQATANKIAESLYALDYQKLQAGIGEYMKKSISFYDSGAEGFYHGLVLGLVALMDDRYKIRSNRESGDGRYDINLISRNPKFPGIIMELKSDKDLDEKELETLSNEALKQNDDKGYDTEMREEGIEVILKLGIAFSGKKVKIQTA